MSGHTDAPCETLLSARLLALSREAHESGRH